MATQSPTRRRRKAMKAFPPPAQVTSRTPSWNPDIGPEMEAVRVAMDALPIGVVFAECVRGGPPSIVAHNAAYARIVGTTVEPCRPCAELPYSVYLPDRMTRVPPEHWPAPRAARTGEVVGERELHLRLASGEWRVVAVSAAPLPRTEGDEAGRAVGVVLDVSDRRRAEDDLSRRGQLLRHVIEMAPDLVVVKNRVGQILFANPATLQALGLRLEQVIGRNTSEVVADPAAARILEENDRRVMASGQEEQVEEVVPTPDGERVFLSTKSPWRDSAGQVIGTVVIARDITARKRTEEALQASERRFRALIEKSSDMVLLVDGGGRYTFWSPAATEALGWEEGDVLGHEALDLVHPDDRADVVQGFRAVLDGAGVPVRHRARLRHRDGGYRLVEGMGRDLRADPAVAAVVLNVRDVTEQSQTEELLLQSQKLESIGRLAGGIAHDFNNLLTVILCGAESEAEALDAGRAVDREDVDQIREAGARAQELTRHLLAFARRQVATPIVLDVNELVVRCERLLHRLLGEDVRIRLELERPTWPVLCDPAQLEQVLVNLAANARDAMPEGGTLTLSTRNVASPHGDPALAAGDWVMLRVQDTGTGMSREVKERIFEPFFTTKPSGKGTGLGLALVYGIVRQAGGQVRVDSDPGRGSTFDVLLPRTRETAVPARAEARKRARGGSETVLLVEDDAGVREAAARALRGGGYRVITADGADAAEKAMREAPEPPAVLVTDVLMPTTTGRELADRIRAGRAGMPVLFLSGHAAAVVGRHGVLEPGVAFLAKPFTPGSLLDKVREVLDRA
ncbi:MAG: PAS domain S-box protein [Anaeromyxobacteraceae bacterium]